METYDESVERVYVKVFSVFDTVGTIFPRAIVWKDGRVFKIQKILSWRPASILGTGFGRNRSEVYTVLINGEEKYLFFERYDRSDKVRVGRWWVERPAMLS